MELVVNGVCPDGHILHWQSQPMVRGMAAGNLLLPAAVLLCGLTFISIANLADVFNLAVFSERYFYRLQKEYLYPVVHANYIRQQEAVIGYLRGTSYTCLEMVAVTVLGIVPSTVHISSWTLPLTSS